MNMNSSVSLIIHKRNGQISPSIKKILLIMGRFNAIYLANNEQTMPFCNEQPIRLHFQENTDLTIIHPKKVKLL